MKIASVTLTNSQEARIGGALRKVVEQVDVCVVVDASRDGLTCQTLSIAQDVAGEKLFQRRFPWIDDFAAARNFALFDATKETGADWAITVDTDERIHWKDLDLRSYLASLPDHVHAVHMRSDDECYAKERAFRTSSPHRFGFRTHECYPAADQPEFPSARFSEFPKTPEEFLHKLERDKKILLSATTENPTCSRSWFYLGQTYAGMDKKHLAQGAYERAFEESSWDEEAAWSAYLVATMLYNTSSKEKALEWCLKGMAKHAEIPELPWYAAWLSLQLGNNHQAARWAKIAENINREAGHKGEKGITRRIGFSYPLAQYDGPTSVLRCAYENLKRMDDAEVTEIRRHELEMLRGGKTLEPRAVELFPSFRASRLDVSPLPGACSVMNPSIAQPPATVHGLVHESRRYTGILRHVNYRVNYEGYHTVGDSDGIFRTRNELVAFDLDENNQLVLDREKLFFGLIEDNTNPTRTNFPVHGYEDMRPFWWRGELWASATVRDRNEAGICQIALLRIDTSTTSGWDQLREDRSPAIVECHIQKGLTPGRHEKNWVPLVDGERLYFVYSTHPLTILEVNPETYQAHPTFTNPKDVPPTLESERGGSQAIPFDGGWLYTTHHAFFLEKTRRYTHRFVWFDAQPPTQIKATPPFVFLSHGVEFSPGLIRVPEHHYPERLIVTFGVRDREAWTASIDADDVRKQLEVIS